MLLYANSDRVLRTLPPDAHGAAIEELREDGSYPSWPTLPQAGHEGFLGSTVFDCGRFGGTPVRGGELTDDQKGSVELVRKLAREKGKTRHAVDVGQETAFRRFIQEPLHQLGRFPVLVRPDGRRLEGIRGSPRKI